MVLGMLRQFVFLLPLVLILPKYFGINGVWYATPIADALAIAITALVLYKDARVSGDADQLETSMAC